MTDFDKSIRTLILCFVIAIFVMVPLRFVEIQNQESVSSDDVHVLGESMTIKFEEKVILPDAEVNVSQLEAPYDVIDGSEIK